MSIGSKFLACIALILLAISSFVFIYYPGEYKSHSLSMMNNKVQSMAEMVALGVGVGRDLNNFNVIDEALNWAKRDKSLAYIIMLDNSGEEYGAYNPQNIPLNTREMLRLNEMFEKNSILNVLAPVRHNDKEFGTLIVGYSLDELYQNISRNRKTSLIVGMTIFALGISLSLLISRRITHPLQQLKNAANKVAGGKNDVRIEFASADEVGELAEAFQIMLKKINQSIEDNKAITTEMEVARDLAVGANQAKSEFLSRMSHELRTPLNAILGFGQLLEIDEEFPLTRKQKDGVEEIIKAGNHLLELINEILDLSKIESGSLGISLEMINLNEVIEEVVSMVDPLKEKYSISIKNNINSNPVINVFADRTRLKQVLLNLMSNAIKYNHKDGVVTLESKISGSDRLQITVADTGKGIPPEYLEAAFEPFNRLDAENTEIEGSGIGLTITKRIMDLMNGTITVESTLGKGSRFTIELPSEQISKEAEV